MLCYVMLCTAVMAMALSVDATDLYACKFFFHFVVVPLLFFRSFSCLLAFRLSTSRLQIFSWGWASFPRIFFYYSQRFSYKFFFIPRYVFVLILMKICDLRKIGYFLLEEEKKIIRDTCFHTHVVVF